MGHGVGDLAVAQVFGGGAGGDAPLVFVGGGLPVQVGDVVGDLVGDADGLEVLADRGELGLVGAAEDRGDLGGAADEHARLEPVGGADLVEEGAGVTGCHGFVERGVVPGEVEGLTGVGARRSRR
ncbi:hypothetical protein M271_48675 [Streptomyces rapamycinicus NRRL 5491]|uniref:Uncharacterized protein n=2 Tax=Streptomyces rapamycinicus TaxID=1226757 RepID=A0A0A0NND4_STRRN|nr:hypothetical protein M271_48675 [Streptomyces rapamycinicus NRRL 5491]MBB4787727.1 hypothetical protein [Streptomyces rapamycinicus]RLV72066.1 hypothetical protein D3C57_146105 [Streptomyces rapamycinicus NRRL 5491]